MRMDVLDVGERFPMVFVGNGVSWAWNGTLGGTPRSVFDGIGRPILGSGQKSGIGLGSVDHP